MVPEFPFRMVHEQQTAPRELVWRCEIPVFVQVYKHCTCQSSNVLIDTGSTNFQQKMSIDYQMSSHVWLLDRAVGTLLCSHDHKLMPIATGSSGPNLRTPYLPRP
jgi:hypothetical protein